MASDTSLVYSVGLSCVRQAALQREGPPQLVMDVDSRLPQLVMFMYVFIENVKVRCGNSSRLFANTGRHRLPRWRKSITSVSCRACQIKRKREREKENNIVFLRN